MYDQNQHFLKTLFARIILLEKIYLYRLQKPSSIQSKKICRSPNIKPKLKYSFQK